MLTTRKPQAPQPTPPEPIREPQRRQQASNGLLTIIDQSLSIAGDLQSNGELQVRGKIRGNIHCQSIIVEQDGCIEGGILADHVLIHGTTKGFIRATHIELGPTAVVESDLYHATLIVRDGAMFEGMSETNKSQRHTEMHTEMQVDELRAVVAQMKTSAAGSEHAAVDAFGSAALAQAAPGVARRA